MATWQFDCVLVPRFEWLQAPRSPAIDVLTESSREYWRNRRPEHVHAALRELGDGEPTWSPMIRRWGPESGTCIELSTEDGVIDEVRIRVDLREAEGSFLRRLCAAASELGCLVVTETARVVEPNAAEIHAAARDSAAASYVADPQAYLQRLRVGARYADEA